MKHLQRIRPRAAGTDVNRNFSAQPGSRERWRSAAPFFTASKNDDFQSTTTKYVLLDLHVDESEAEEKKKKTELGHEHRS